MTEYSELVDRYKKYRAINQRLNSTLTKQIPKNVAENTNVAVAGDSMRKS